jgi:superfamily II DNA or RNA helicase
MPTATSFAPGDAVRIRGDRWTITRHVAYGDCAILEARRSAAPGHGERATFVLPAEPVERLARSHRPRVVTPSRWRHAARAVLGSTSPSPVSLLTAARGAFDILPYQLEPALAITSGAACRLLIADEVGLGKTIQATLCVSEILERAVDGRALVVTPAALRSQWQDEIARWFNLRAAIVDAPALASLGASVSANPWSTHRLAIVSIDFIKRPEVLRSIEGLVWDVVVFDEAHALAGRSDRARAADLLASRARHVVLLTATPHAGDDAAFNRLCATGDVDGRFPCLLFHRTRQDAGVASARRTHWCRIAPTPAEQRMHAALSDYARTVWRASTSPAARLAVAVLARRAASSAASLVRSLERRLALLTDRRELAAQLPLPIDERVSDDEVPDGILATPGLQDTRRECDWLQHLLALATAASIHESKIGALRRLLRRARVPALVFTEYRDTLERVSAELGEGVIHLHGAMTMTEREEAARAFTQGGAMVMLATDAASEGLNLQRRCHLVVNLELPWSPVRLEQRIGRVDRIGQRQRVHAVHLLASGTIEERIVARLLRRGQRAKTALDAPLTPAHDLTPLDLRSLATAEASRITTARALLTKSPRDGDLERPLLANLSRARTGERRCWLFRLRVDDRADEAVWDTVIGVIALTTRATLRTSSDLRTALGTDLIEVHARAAVAMLGHRIRAALMPIAQLAENRERAIRAVLERRHGRMAAVLAQRSLFDHQHDRAAAAQQRILDEAIRRCADRLQRVHALRDIVVRRDLLLAAALD